MRFWKLTDFLKRYRAFWFSGWRRWPALIEFSGSEKILVIAPHIDDECLGCGGSILMHKEKGGHAVVAYLSGNPGSIRALEAKEASKRFNFERTYFVGVNDDIVVDDGGVRERLREIILCEKPDIIFVPWPFDDEICHLKANRVLGGVLRDIGVMCVFFLYEVWTPLPANVVVDISRVIASKKEILSLYQSQTKKTDLIGPTEGLNRYRSLHNLGGIGYAEGFIKLSRAEYLDFLA